MCRNPAALTAALLLAGCGHAAVKPVVPKEVKVPVVQYVPLPEALTKPCPPVHAEGRKVEAVVSAYNANIVMQADCDARMARIRELQPTNEKL